MEGGEGGILPKADKLWLSRKYGSTTLEIMKYVRECYPLQIAEYFHQIRISQEPLFLWWFPNLMKKINIIISKLQSKYLTQAHKYGVMIPKSVKEAISLDKWNGSTLWWEAIVKEMENVRTYFELYEGNMEDFPPGYQEVCWHITFDVNMGENFRRKSRMVVGGHKITTSHFLTC